MRKSHPHLTKRLELAELNRSTHLGRYRDGVRLRGLDELFRVISEATAQLASYPETQPIADLLSRAEADFVIGVDAALAGYVSVAHDSMRDVMEIELLLKEFEHEPAQLTRWLTADQKTRAEFRPARLRKQQAIIRGIDVKDLPDSVDYRGHSEALHVNPGHPIMSTRSPAGIGEVPFGVDGCFWELFEHARRLLIATERLLQQDEFNVGAKALPALEELSAFSEGWERTQEMQALFLALLEASVDDSEDDRD